MKMMWIALVATAALATAQDRATVRQYVDAHQRQIVAEFTELLSIPNVGTDAAGIRRNTDFLVAMLQRHGLKAELLPTSGNPLVYAERGLAHRAKGHDTEAQKDFEHGLKLNNDLRLMIDLHLMDLQMQMKEMRRRQALVHRNIA